MRHTIEPTARTSDERMTDEMACELIRTYRETADVRYRNEVVNGHHWLAVVCARGMMRRSESLDDLVQVASIGLLKATERFDPSFGVLFRTFASATIDGELRRHYRGTWRLRVSRGLQELHLQVSAAIDHLTQQNQASPTLQEVAAYLRRPYDDVLDAFVVGASHRPAPLESHSDDAVARERAELGGDDEELSRVVDRTYVEGLMARLPERERRIVECRFVLQLTQSEIAQELELSQAHVSRLLRSAIDRMRALATHGSPTA
jgi:RNA polymerase sigma-B factor